jgi:hypothetical protein
MTTHKSIGAIGAINKLTGKYVYPANKTDKYICIECNRDLIWCNGEIRCPYFRHYADNDPCKMLTCPTESQQHKNAKFLMQSILEGNIPFELTRKCWCCKTVEQFEIPEVSNTSSIQLEHRFQYNGELKIADVAYIDDGELVTIFEIFHTHATQSDDRPEPWFEIDATELINNANDANNGVIKINCIRDEKCDDCIERKKKEEERERKEKEEKRKINEKKLEIMKKNKAIREEKERCLYGGKTLAEIESEKEAKERSLYGGKTLAEIAIETHKKNYERNKQILALYKFLNKDNPNIINVPHNYTGNIEQYPILVNKLY